MAENRSAKAGTRGRSTSAGDEGNGQARRDPHDDPIKHVVVLMLENRSFDQMLGALHAVYPDLDGARPPGTPPRTNPAPDGPPVAQEPKAEKQMKGDPKHELPNALAQLGQHNDGFVRDYATSYPHSPRHEWEQVMAYFPLHALPGLHAIARQFKVCDRWFSSLPGATWPNRLFFHSGTSIGRAKMPQGLFDLSRHRYNQDTLYDRLNERGIAWKIYYGDFPQSMLLEHQWRPNNARRYRPMDEFYADAKGPAERFPAFSFIEPRYYAPDQNDDHPPHDVMGAQRLTADVYNAIRANRELWESTLLLILYDEHGGFYDHVSPPQTIPPDEHRDEYSFDRLGVRVPAVLVSPWVDKGVDHTVYDHTSLLKYLIDKWKLNPLGERAARANSFATILRRPEDGPRQDAPDSIDVPQRTAEEAMAEAAAAATELNELQMAMVALAMHLEKMTPGAPKEKLDRLNALMDNPASQVRFAAGAIQRFAEHAEETHRRESETRRAHGRVVDKGHPGKGGQGQAHRKKVTATKVRHEKAEGGRAAKKGGAG